MPSGYPRHSRRTDAFVNLGGTVVVGEREALELNSISTRLMRV